MSTFLLSVSYVWDTVLDMFYVFSHHNWPDEKSFYGGENPGLEMLGTSPTAQIQRLA